MKNIVLFLALLPALLAPPYALAESTLSMTVADDMVTLVGENVDGIVAIDVTLNYDTTFFSDPQPDLRGGTITKVSAETPGEIEVEVTREDPHAMFELFFTFARKGDSRGIINFVTGTATDGEGQLYPIRLTPVYDSSAQAPATGGKDDAKTASASLPTDEGRSAGGITVKSEAVTPGAAAEAPVASNRPGPERSGS